jgi:CHAD domain-containing protein
MGLEPLQYRVSGRVDLGALCRALPRRLRARRVRRYVSARTFLDTFDWRIYQRGAVLLEEVAPGSGRLLWRELGSARSLGALEVARAPRFVSELPEGLFRERLGAIVEGRALLAVARLRSHVRAFDLLNRDGKIVARVASERSELIGAGGAPGAALGERVQLLPVRGYPRARREVARLLDEAAGLEREDGDLFLAALAALERRPGDYSPKLQLRLAHLGRACTAVRELLLHLLGMLEANQEGVLCDLDAEFLHDLRVAIRRTRAALRHLGAALPPPAVARFRAEFAWAGQLTGPARDLDVYLAEFPRFRALLPAGMQPDLESVHELLRSRRASAHLELVASLQSERWRALLAEWRAFLDGADGAPAGEAGDRAVRELAGESIRRVHRIVLRRGRAIDPEAPAAKLHELRKRCKDLRYLLEFFRSLYPPAGLAELLQALRGLQDALGTFQDLEVQVGVLGGLGHELGAGGKAPPEALVALGALIDRLAQRREAARASFADRFAAFDTPARRALLTELLAAGARGAEAS